MARSAENDAVEKFRFQITVFETRAGLGFTPQTSNVGTTEDNVIIHRGGFSEVTSPRVAVKGMTYRENNMGNSPLKAPGMATYEPVTLRRGVTSDKGLYSWYIKVNNDAGALNKFQSGITGLGTIPFQEPDFRREVLISSIDRTGTFVKHWLLYDAFPAAYRGSNDFNAEANEILTEELTLDYEFFVEVNGSSIEEALRNASDEGVKAAQKAAASFATNVVGGIFASVIPGS